MANNITVESLNDNLLSDYIGRINMQYIMLLNTVAYTVKGSKQYGSAVVDLRACEKRYKKAIVEALSRGIVLTN